jgi:hypothetical protein
MAEVGIAILIVGSLLILDRERLSWVSGRVRDLYEWLSS